MKESLPIAGTTISHYRILSRLGAGGMGEVYLAEDTKLARQVAIKVLPAGSIADERAHKRLIREAQSAATLDHPNICSIYEVGEEGSRSFIVMQYVKGETLAGRIQRNPMNLQEALDVAAQVADALTEAHSQGIIHRDIKPQNIMITARGQVKVMDFGLAKVVKERSLTVSEAETESLLTEPGTIIGTVPYMSPEQVRGETLDSRSDMFSFGAVVYEMVSGRQPFAAESAAATTSAILTTEPLPLARYSREAPAELERIVSKALRKDREERYQSARDLLIDLKSLKHHRDLEAEVERSKKSISVAATGGQAIGERTKESATPTREALAPATSSIEYVITGVLRHKVPFAALALALITLAGVGVYLLSSGGKAIDSVAILPFVNVSADPNTEYLSDGITESLISSLSQLPNLKVMSRSSAFRYKGREIDPQAVGRELKVQAVLTGRVVQRGEGLAISLELVDARDNRQLWGEQYNRKLSDILAVQAEISREISQKLRLRLSGAEQKQLTKHHTENAEAYQLYLKGRHHWNKLAEEETKKAIEYFNRAIESDPSYVLAYAGLADCYSHLVLFGSSPQKDTFPKAKAAAMKAI
ncbi:MAG: protein kinase [Acidobacteriota bacterium]